MYPIKELATDFRRLSIKSGDTIMLYACCPRYYDEVGRGELTPDASNPEHKILLDLLMRTNTCAPMTSDWIGERLRLNVA